MTARAAWATDAAVTLLRKPRTKSFRFCDESAVPGRPYCDAHAAKAFVRVRDRREDAELARASGGGD
jgi:hypothetical protein